MEEIFATDETNCLELTVGEWEARDLHRKFTEIVLCAAAAAAVGATHPHSSPWAVTRSSRCAADRVTRQPRPSGAPHGRLGDGAGVAAAHARLSTLPPVTRTVVEPPAEA